MDDYVYISSDIYKDKRLKKLDDTSHLLYISMYLECGRLDVPGRLTFGQIKEIPRCPENLMKHLKRIKKQGLIKIDGDGVILVEWDQAQVLGQAQDILNGEL